MAATGTMYRIGRFSSNGHTTKPVICAEIANKSMITLIARRPSFDDRDSKPSIPTVKQKRNLKHFLVFPILHLLPQAFYLAHSISNL